MDDSDSDQNELTPGNDTQKQKGVDWNATKAERKRRYKEWKEKKLIRKLEKRRKEEEDATVVGENVDKNGPDKHVKRKQVPTVSIAVPGSILDNAQTQELRTLLAGQVARAVSISCVDEVIVYDETGTTSASETLNEFPENPGMTVSPIFQMARILQYLECPQYLRKYFFPLHKDLKHAGLLPPLDAPHHLREMDVSNFREGVVLDRPVKDGQGSFVNIGLHKDVQVDKKLDAGLRVTVHLEDANDKTKRRKGQAVDPSTPRGVEGVYWGYNVRLAQSLGAIFTQCPYSGGYDLTIGTSDKGDNVDKLELPPFKHLLIVFGGVKGLEYGLDCDESLTVDDPQHLFHLYLNSFPGQGSRTIRTEEAILLTMAVLRSKIQKNIGLPIT